MSYSVRFPWEKLNELSTTVTNLLTQVSDLSTAVTFLTQHLTQLENEPAYSLPPMPHSLNSHVLIYII